MRIFYSEVFKDHKPEGYHPENPKRLEFAIEGLKECDLWINVEEPPRAEINDILKVHSNEYVKKIQGLSESGFSFIDLDTYVSLHTWEAALTAFGASMQVAKLALKKKDVYLALVRPPGHHAGKKGRALGAPTLGFCIFNNAAGAALMLKEKAGKVVIIDFDVHHGNGTQDIFWDDGDIVHIDLHESGIYPGSGDIYEIGGKGAEGSKINIPMSHYSKDDDYIFVWKEVVLPILEDIGPRAIVVSAGFDAFKGDGLATMELSERFYHFAGASLSRFSLALILEGGYSVGLRKGLPAFIEGYLEGEPELEKISPKYGTIKVVEEVREIQSEWWEGDF